MKISREDKIKDKKGRHKGGEIERVKGKRKVPE